MPGSTGRTVATRVNLGFLRTVSVATFPVSGKGLRTLPNRGELAPLCPEDQVSICPNSLPVQRIPDLTIGFVLRISIAAIFSLFTDMTLQNSSNLRAGRFLPAPNATATLSTIIL